MKLAAGTVLTQRVAKYIDVTKIKQQQNETTYLLCSRPSIAQMNLQFFPQCARNVLYRSNSQEREYIYTNR